jgi:large subunit ribosomal protein L17
MLVSLFIHERIRTTDPKAKELKSIAEKIITYSKKGDLHSRRLAARFIRDKRALKKLFSSIADRFRDRQGGYTRIIKLGRRAGDGSSVSILELISEKKEGKKVKKKG